MSDAAVFRDGESDAAYKAKWWTSRIVIYAILIFWAIVCIFPIYWTLTTSFKLQADVMRGSIVPWLQFDPVWNGWRSLGLSPETIGASSTARDQFMGRFENTAIVAFFASSLAVFLGSMTGYGLSRFGYRFAWMKNNDISFFFISQLILPPVVLALPFLILYKQIGLLDTHLGLILLYTLSVLPIVIWIMRDQFIAIPPELEEAALVDGQGVWGAFVRIILPIAAPGMVAAFVLSLVLTWNEYFLASLLTSSSAATLPAMVASQIGSQGVAWANMAAISFAAILPLLIIGVLLERFIIKGMAAGATKG